ncbi:MAG: 4Fe-4S dicluster domain-containing protein [Candidatus Palauibacterales bacterium]|nr:4Fe-4S dicluster domain-containing protein [Candidatus Palauibacterales bacterium]
MQVIEREGLDALFAHLVTEGYDLIGPTVRDQAIGYGSIRSTSDLPEGWTEEQDGGRYRLGRRGDRALFGYALGPDAWKRCLYPPQRRLWSARRREDGLELRTDEGPEPRYALIGVRGCELHAIRIQDRVLLEGVFADPTYRSRREAAFLVAVQCGDPGGTCFCASMGTGPGVDGGYDLALTEILDPDGSHFTVTAGSGRGERMLERLPRREASAADEAAAAEVVSRASGRMGRTLDTAGLRELLVETLEHPRWEKVADRCLTCGNCTLVCPTCFCSSVEETGDLSGRVAERWRRWDSCFHIDFSHLHGGSVRQSAASRYRQWLTHKLGTWFDQFGSSGCVGCGRCITWCPVGIDLTEEVAALRRSASASPGDAPEHRETTGIGGEA